MAEFIQSAEQFISVNESVVFVNNTDSNFEVGTGIIFRKSGLYEVSVVGNRITVTKVSDLTREALKQESCTDAISRQAVLNLAKFDGRDGLGSIIHAFDVEQLPSVNSAEKVGHWIKKEHEICFTCNRCWVTNASGTKYNYCPNCGAKMEVKK